MAAELLLEIGTEEIPSGYLQQGVREFKRLMAVCLQENRIQREGDLEAYATPRRLVLIGKGIFEKQEDLVEEVSGPPKTVAYDEQGNPTKAALGFAAKQGVAVDKLGFKKTSKGEYLYLKRLVPGKPTRDILAEALPQLISEIPWPKSMRWGNLAFPFVRPIHWVLAILDGAVIPFEVAGIGSGNVTWGHRFMAPQAKQISSVEDYLRKMGESFVVISHQEREKLVEKTVREAALTVKGRPAQDPELLSTVANLVEYPSAICGGFDKDFLRLPDAVLITAMREHQKYFSVCDEKGKLMCNFVAVNNTLARDESIVRKGHERVLRARLSDAGFFFKEDRKRPLRDRLEDLKGVIYQTDLGTSRAKVERFTRLAEYLCERFLPDGRDEVRTVAELCKCDLVTEMVSEFPSLQGKIGEVYARMDGYPEEISSAIREHYLPERAGGELPVSDVAAIVGCADRVDTISGCFAVGLEPTGSADPFALRRHALAIIRIIEDRGWDLSLKNFFERSLSILREEINFETSQVFSRMWEFFRERYRHMMLRSGYDLELIEAAISVEFDRINQMRARIDGLKRFTSESEEFHGLALTFKRITNILKKQEASFDVDTALFKNRSESSLWQAYQELKDDVLKQLEAGRYYDALNVLVRLRKPVDEFFDSVEIMVKDNENLKYNRLALLQYLTKLFLRVADLSKFSI